MENAQAFADALATFIKPFIKDLDLDDRLDVRRPDGLLYLPVAPTVAEIEPKA